VSGWSIKGIHPARAAPGYLDAQSFSTNVWA